MSIRNLCPSEDLKESLGLIDLRWKNMFAGDINVTNSIDADIINANNIYVTYINDFQISQTPQANTIVVSRTDGTIHPDWYTVFATSPKISALRYTGHIKTNAALYGGNVNPTNITRLNYDGSFYATRLQVTGDDKEPGFLYTGDDDPDSTLHRLNFNGKFYATQFTATGVVKEPGFFYTGTDDPTSDHRLNYDGNLHMSRLRVTGSTRTPDMFYAGMEDPITTTTRLNYDGNVFASRLQVTGVDKAPGYLYAGNTDPDSTTHRLNYDGSFYATRIQLTGNIKEPGFLYTGTNNPSNTTHRLNYDGKFYATQFTATGVVKEPGFFYTGTDDPTSDHRLNYDGNLHMSRLRVTGSTRTPDMFYAGLQNPVTDTARVNYDGYLYATKLQITSTAREAGFFYLGTTQPSSTTRLNYDGYFYATRVYNAVYNDYAECFENNNYLIYDKIKNRIVALNNDGKVELANPEATNVIGIVSDNYGMVLGGTEEQILIGVKIPVGLVGTLYVDSEKTVNEMYLFSFVCSGVDGKARVIPKGAAYKYEGCIVGKIIDIDEKNNRYKILLSLH